MTFTEWYQLWYRIKSRCLNPECSNYQDYGGRGITMCTEWADNLPQFICDVQSTIGDRPDGTTLDRCKNNEGYSIGNIRWATRSEQSYNRRDRPNRTGHKFVGVTQRGQYRTMIRGPGGKILFSFIHSSLDVVVAARDDAIARLASSNLL